MIDAVSDWHIEGSEALQLREGTPLELLDSVFWDTVDIRDDSPRLLMKNMRLMGPYLLAS